MRMPEVSRFSRLLLSARLERQAEQFQTAISKANHFRPNMSVQVKARGAESSNTVVHRINHGGATLQLSPTVGYTLNNLMQIIPALREASDISMEGSTLIINDHALFQVAKEMLDSEVDRITSAITEGQRLDDVAVERDMTREQIVTLLAEGGLVVTVREPGGDNGQVEWVEIRDVRDDTLIVDSYHDYRDGTHTVRYTNSDGDEVSRSVYHDGKVSETIINDGGEATTTITQPNGTVIKNIVEANGRRTTTSTEEQEEGVALVTQEVSANGYTLGSVRKVLP